MILIVSSEIVERRMEKLATACENMGVEYNVIDTAQWPDGGTMTVTGDGKRIELDGVEYTPNDVSGIIGFFNEYLDPMFPRFQDDIKMNPLKKRMIVNEHRSIIESQFRLLSEFGVKTIPKPESIRLHYSSTYRQAQLENNDDISVAESLFTNSKKEAEMFIKEKDKVVHKPVVSGASTSLVTDNTDLSLLSACPNQFQEYAEGQEYKAFVLDGEIAGAIRYTNVDTVDYSDSDFRAESIELPEKIARACVSAVECLDLIWGSVDIKVQDDNTYKILEVNPEGSWASGIGVEEEIVSYFRD